MKRKRNAEQDLNFEVIKKIKTEQGTNIDKTLINKDEKFEISKKIEKSNILHESEIGIL